VSEERVSALPHPLQSLHNLGLVQRRASLSLTFCLHVSHPHQLPHAESTVTAYLSMLQMRVAQEAVEEEAWEEEAWV
jgi:hypothetical protein